MQELTILKTTIRRDSAGRFCLNDLHRVAGGEARHSPNRYTRTEGFQALVAEQTPEMAFAPVALVHGGASPGTYVTKELVYAYAMWVSPKFHLAVIRAFDALVTGQPPSPIRADEHPIVAQFWDTYEELIERGERVNYSDNQGLIAIHLTPLILAAWRRGLPIAERSKLSRLLKTSLQYPFIGREDMFSRGRRIPKCWVFRDDGRRHHTADATPMRLTGTVSAAPDIVFSQNRHELAEQCSDIALRIGGTAHALAGVGEALRKNAIEPHQAITLLGSLMRDLGTHIEATDAAWH